MSVYICSYNCGIYLQDNKKRYTLWRMDERYIKVAGKERCFYRAVRKYGDASNEAIANNQNPKIINIDNSRSNFTAIRALKRNNLWNNKIRRCIP